MSDEMIITRTPLRISFAGGGTDLPDFYRSEEGAVLSAAIDKFVYVTLKRHGSLFDEALRLNYFETELVQRVDEVRNDIARECLRMLHVDPPLYISTIGDVPASSGLGSSSSFAVGLLNALHAYRGERVPAGVLAEEAARIEIDVLGRPIGKQDHYAAAYGGMHLYRFRRDGSVTVETQQFSEGAPEMLFEHLMMFWTGIRRDAGSVLAEQKRNTVDRVANLRAMRDSVSSLRELLQGQWDSQSLGAALNAGWTEKRQMASTISNGRIDEWYERGLAAGAAGGKLCGAGGGGFLLFAVEPARRDAVRRALHDLRELTVRYEVRGSRVLLPAGW
jgi:D-glycero-alpha-D-manno-heptose-7-phosphate kinase